MHNSDWEHVGEIGVDAGIVMVGDPCYINDVDHPVKDWSKFCSSLDSPATQLKYPMGHTGLGVVVSSGYGDGVYPVYIRRENGVVVEMKVVFVGDEEDEE